VLEGVEGAGAEGADAGRGALLGLPRRGERGHAPVLGLDHERRVAEGAHAEFVAQERLLVHRAIARRLVAAGPARELLGRQRLTIGLRRRARGGNAAHVVARPRAFEIGMAPGGARRLPVRVLHLGGRGLGRDRPQGRRRLGRAKPSTLRGGERDHTGDQSQHQERLSHHASNSPIRSRLMTSPARPVLLVTGGSRGIGAATVRLAAERGYDVCVNYRANAEAATRMVDDVRRAGARAIAVQADIAVEADVVRMFETCDAELGRLSALVNNAAILETQSRLDAMDAARIARVFGTNVTGAFLCSREAVRRLSTRYGGVGGAIVNVSSGASRMGSPGEY